MGTTINLGTKFALPYPNKLSIVRRLLSVNPTMHVVDVLGFIEKDKNGSRYSLFSSTTQVYSPSFRRTGPLLRQCGKCAELLYHNDLYELSWVIKCPIHNCQLSALCPTCRKPWPNYQQLPLRDCETCSVKSMQSLASIAEKIDVKKTLHCIQPIDTLARPIESLELRKEVTPGQNYAHSRLWCIKSNINSDCYPSFAIKYYPHLTESFVKTLNVKLYELESLPLINTSETRTSNVLTSIDKLDCEYEVFSEITEWIRSFCPELLNISVHASFRSQSARPLCPISLALNIWLHLLVYQKIDFKESFPSLYDVALPERLNGALLDVCDLGLQGGIPISSSSRRALYLRGLRVSFASLYRAINLTWNENEHCYSKSPDLLRQVEELKALPVQYYVVMPHSKKKDIWLTKGEALAEFPYLKNTNISLTPNSSSSNLTIRLTAPTSEEAFISYLNAIKSRIAPPGRLGYTSNEFKRMEIALFRH